MNRSPRTKFSILTLVLLVVPLCLTGCLKRTILSENGNTSPGKHVSGRLTPSGPVAVAVGQGAHLGQPNKFFPVWFTRASGENLDYVCEERQAPFQVADPTTQLNFVMSQLLAGPAAGGKDGPGLSSEIPKGTKLLSAYQYQGQLVINLSHDFLAGGGNDSFEARLEQVRRTVSPIAGGQPVYLDIDGKQLTTSGDGLEVKQPINQVEGSAAPPVN